MATENAIPSRDPANDDSLVGLLNEVLGKFLQGVDDMLPAIVTAVGGTRNNPRVTVRPVITVITTDGQRVTRAVVASVPVMQFGGGGAILSFNIQEGDLGWIKASDRDISLFLQKYKESPPNTFRKHTFQDAVFIPDVMRGYTVAAEDATCAVLQSVDGSLKVSVGAGRVKLAAGPSSVTVAAAGVTIVGPVVTINGIIWDTHRHAPAVIPPSNP